MFNWALIAHYSGTFLSHSRPKPCMSDSTKCNPGTFLIQAQTVNATGQIQWQTFQVQANQLPQGAGPGRAADLSPDLYPPSEPDKPDQPAQPPNNRSELCSTRWSSVHTGVGCKLSNWYLDNGGARL
ncbi:hypothetical protein EPR50_G00231010 [Perca flavescens]|uniref:Uncharacterized protein n=1 Tax=Perca flavescens TaxID=8167 RepID=A0A484C003_PERFV|nr:hypothetical protein EPR50_G00231010 [Perca flavescens]